MLQTKKDGVGDWPFLHTGRVLLQADPTCKAYGDGKIELKIPRFHHWADREYNANRR